MSRADLDGAGASWRDQSRPLAVVGLLVAALVAGFGVQQARPQRSEPTALATPSSPSPAESPTPAPLPPILDSIHPGIPPSSAGLAPEMQRRVSRAIAAAKMAKVTLRVNEGFRTRARQQQLHLRALRTYGSVKEASKWVLPAAKSEHPRGRAVDVGPPSAAAWLDRFGYRFGLCRRYTNEPWHYEPLTYPGFPCPAREPYARG